jgi:hypothetical protein
VRTAGGSQNGSLEPISKMRLSVQGGVVPQIEILTYFVYAPFSIYGTLDAYINVLRLDM